MNIRDLLTRFSGIVDTLPADERALLGELADRLQSMSDRDIADALAAGAQRGLALRTGVRAGGPETDDRA